MKSAKLNVAPMTVEMRPIDSLVPYEKNPRDNWPAVKKVADSLREFGWKQPIVVDRKMKIVVGHTRLLAARLLGYREVPVIVATDLTPNQAKAYRLADNRTNEEAEWIPEMLAGEIADLRDAGYDLEMTGFDASELNKLRLAEEGALEPERQLSDELHFQVVVDCADEADQAALMALLKDQKRVCKPLTI